MLTEEVLTSIDESVLCWLATVDVHGTPNVSPKEMFVAYGKGNHKTHILIANIASPNSVANIRANPAVCLSFVHVFKQKGFKLHGTARILNKDDASFSEKHQLLYALTGDDFPFQRIIEIEVLKVNPILSPRYRLFPNTTEEDQINSALHPYGVKAK